MLPSETIRAVFPSSVRAGEILLGPMSLFHAVAMEAMGVELEGNNTDAKMLIAGWILTLPIEELPSVINGEDTTKRCGKWMNKLTGVERQKVKAAVVQICRDAFSTFVPPKTDKHTRFDDLGEGYGWELEVGECIAHEHGVTFDEAMKTPVVRALALIAVMRQRNGGESGGPDYYDRIREKRIKEMFSTMR